MPFTVITLKNSPSSLRGDLTKWMQEIATGVYVGNFNSKIRAMLWQRVIESVGHGEATLSYANRNELGYIFETHNSIKTSLDFDGIPLVFTPIKCINEEIEAHYGFSRAAKLRKAKIYSRGIKQNRESALDCVVIDVETTGLDPNRDVIIEIGAIKYSDSIEEYACLVRHDIKVPQSIQQLTGITSDQLREGIEEKEAIAGLIDFIGTKVIVGYNINFDIEFLNKSRKRCGKPMVSNDTYDIMKYVKEEKLFLKNYKLETVLKAYGVNIQVPHRALEDAKIIRVLMSKMVKLPKILYK